MMQDDNGDYVADLSLYEDSGEWEDAADLPMFPMVGASGYEREMRRVSSGAGAAGERRSGRSWYFVTALVSGNMCFIVALPLAPVDR
eukprot:scaffold32239_cov30-Prasinocladus_malaysianus.AAC.1